MIRGAQGRAGGPRAVGRTEHDERVARYCGLLGALAGMDRRSCIELTQAARLHDIGHVTIPQEILDRPGVLDDVERALVERHAAYGHDLLAMPGNAFMTFAATIAWTHHERWDGKGYPRALRGELIPRAGRIVAICDVFDALTSDRAHRPALALGDAVAQMHAGHRTAFDPELLEIFLASLDEFVRLGEEDGRYGGAVGRALRIGAGQRARPR
jgi:putative two-component system response regulator